MAKSIQDLRKDAGYRTAAEFAEACGFTRSSLARYEGEQENVPVKSAWKMADVLGCSIDDIVGRDSDVTADLRGPVQRRYDALPPTLRPALEDYLDYLESKAGEAASARSRLMGDCYMDMFKLYMVMFLEGLDEQSKAEALSGSPSVAMRARFQEFACGKVFGASQSFADGEEVMEGLMQAYDGFYAKPGAPVMGES